MNALRVETSGTKRAEGFESLYQLRGSTVKGKLGGKEVEVTLPGSKFWESKSSWARRAKNHLSEQALKTGQNYDPILKEMKTFTKENRNLRFRKIFFSGLRTEVHNKLSTSINNHLCLKELDNLHHLLNRESFNYKELQEKFIQLQTDAKGTDIEGKVIEFAEIVGKDLSSQIKECLVKAQERPPYAIASKEIERAENLLHSLDTITEKASLPPSTTAARETLRQVKESQEKHQEELSSLLQSTKDTISGISADTFREIEEIKLCRDNLQKVISQGAEPSLVEEAREALEELSEKVDFKPLKDQVTSFFYGEEALSMRSQKTSYEGHVRPYIEILKEASVGVHPHTLRQIETLFRENRGEITHPSAKAETFKKLFSDLLEGVEGKFQNSFTPKEPSPKKRVLFLDSKKSMEKVSLWQKRADYLQKQGFSKSLIQELHHAMRASEANKETFSSNLKRQLQQAWVKMGEGWDPQWLVQYKYQFKFTPEGFQYRTIYNRETKGKANDLFKLQGAMKSTCKQQGKEDLIESLDRVILSLSHATNHKEYLAWVEKVWTDYPHAE